MLKNYIIAFVFKSKSPLLFDLSSQWFWTKYGLQESFPNTVEHSFSRTAYSLRAMQGDLTTA
jgi:hypothetical protein